ncbi:MAG: nucleotidyltransferase domain-containing protein [Nanoarchaeota archaeon]|nr:nucleotidyltransferase domain-containing protein [Nanoarchaeota archaeon]
MKGDFFSMSKRELSREELIILEKAAKELKKILEKSIKKNKISAEIFIGGSLARRTLVKKDINDIDIFVRFDRKYENQDLSRLLSKIVGQIKIEGQIDKIHGSRDYFRIMRENVLFEIIPVLRVRNPKDAKNVTDLSYFHVNYIKNKMKKGINPREMVKAKAFCKAAGVYGAESYIRGFSGYGLECLIVNYRSFEKMLKELTKVKERIILDPERFYKNKDQIIMELNENKLKSPIVLIDPTWKERNVLAALSKESFEKFQEFARAFLKNPSSEFFNFRERDSSKVVEKAKNNKGEFCEILLNTPKQVGDIAGSKLKKFYNMLIKDVLREFNIIASEFYYSNNEQAFVWIATKPKKDLIKEGPLSEMKEHVTEFKKRHPKVFIDKGRIYARIRTSKNLSEFIKNYKRNYKKKISEMDISKIKIKREIDFNKL